MRLNLIRTMCALSALLGGLIGRARAVEVPQIFGNGMVLQRDRPVPIWGRGEVGENVSVEFAGQKKTAVVGADGKWNVRLEPMKAGAEPRTMTIQGKNALTINDVVVGEVWLASGQSNMHWTFAQGMGVRDNEKELDAANDPVVRQFTVNKGNRDPKQVPGRWRKANRAELLEGGQNGDSALGYFFARELRRELNVPVGIINASVGGTLIESWLPNGELSKGLVQPAAPYALRGFLWYQGESNVIQGDTAVYTEKLRTLIGDWRSRWGRDDLPFYFVQIAPYLYTGHKLTKEALPFFWEAQAKVLGAPHTGMVVTTDLVDSVGDIHPRNKQDVAKRLASLALARDYGRKGVIDSGPVYQSMKIRGNKIVLTFEHIAGGLQSRDGKPLSEFSIATVDGKFVPAQAVIEDGKIVVSSPGVAAPLAVRFAWHEATMPNLINKAGLPAVPFRTDNWPGR